MKAICSKGEREVRSFWIFGASPDEIAAMRACHRPAGHRGKCGLSERPEPPLREIAGVGYARRVYV